MPDTEVVQHQLAQQELEGMAALSYEEFLRRLTQAVDTEVRKTSVRSTIFIHTSECGFIVLHSAKTKKVLWPFRHHRSLKRSTTDGGTISEDIEARTEDFFCLTNHDQPTYSKGTKQTNAHKMSDSNRCFLLGERVPMM